MPYACHDRLCGAIDCATCHPCYIEPNECHSCGECFNDDDLWRCEKCGENFCKSCVNDGLCSECEKESEGIG